MPLKSRRLRVMPWPRRRCATWLLVLTMLPAGALLPMALHAGEPPHHRIDIPNAEDLALLDSGDWVIASSMPGGEHSHGALYAIAVDSRHVRSLVTERPGEARAEGECDAPVPSDQFSPHGIAVQSFDGRETLLVVHHGPRESVEIYDVRETAAGPELAWRDCLMLPEGAVGNAVAATPDGRVFVTNMGQLLEPEGDEARWLGEVLVWSSGVGWGAVPGSRIFAVNGLLVSDDGSELYVASWAAGEVIRFSVADAASRQTLPLPFLPDNLRWGPQGEVLAAGLRGTPEQVVACVMAAGPCEHSVPTGVAVIDAEGFEVDCTRDFDLQMGTVALAVAGDLWLGPVRGDEVHVHRGVCPR